MIKEFDYYLKNDLVRRKDIDKFEAEALIEKAENRIDFIKSNDIKEKNSSFIFEEIYECLREAFQSLMSLRGYKPYSHEAIVAFLKKFVDFEERDISVFDQYRILRNKAMYRAEKISSEKCKESLKFLLQLFPKIKKEFNDFK
jgi:uncharacterized protein YutE (UPF0331/DUF86 family)